MNTTLETGRALAREITHGVASIPDVQVAIFPPALYVLPIAGVLGRADTRIFLGAQNCSSEKPGALTGELAVEQLADCAVRIVLVGHSERRHILGETDEVIGRKLRAVLAGGLIGMLCIGETLAQREAGETNQVNERQLRTALQGFDPSWVDRLIIAYEPVWAIGTGRTATPADAQSAHKHVRAVLGEILGSDAAARTRVLYGGSVKSGNARELFAQADIDGGLIGGASLVAGEFLAIVEAARPVHG